MDGGREETRERRGRGDQMDGRMEVRGGEGLWREGERESLGKEWKERQGSSDGWKDEGNKGERYYGWREGEGGVIRWMEGWW